MCNYVIVILTLVNSLSVRAASLVQNIFTVAKLFALALIIGTGIVLLCIGGEYYAPFKNAWAGTKTDASAYAFACYSGLWAYGGW